MNVFDSMGKYWVEIADQNQTERQVEFLKKALKPNGVVLDLACGTGRHLIPLSKKGYDVVGLDISLKLLKIAKLRWRGAALVQADMRFLPFKPEAFAAAVSMDTSFGYLPSLEDDLQSLRELQASLSRGGVLIVDVFNRERLIQRHSISSEPKLREYPSFFLQQKRTVEADRVHDLWVVKDKADGQTRFFEHVARLYTLDGLQGLLETAGFSVTAVYGNYEDQSWTADSSRLILVASAK
jgi:SAM-dependent methyltransferase